MQTSQNLKAPKIVLAIPGKFTNIIISKFVEL